MKRLLATLVFLCAAPALAQEPPPPAPAQPTPGGREVARAHFQSGEAKFRAGDYRAALKEFLAADAIAPSPILVHNAAVCHERLGEAAEAVRRYREYISRRPDAPNRREIEIRIAALEGAQRPPEMLPGEDEGDDGDALGQPQGMKPPAATAPPVRPYDAPFARRVPSRSAPEQPPTPQQPPPQQAQAPPPAQMQAQQAQAPQYPEPPAPAPTAKKSKPVYKQWWFWVFVGVGTLILIDVASSGGDDNPPAVTRGLEFRF